MSSALVGGFFTAKSTGKPCNSFYIGLFSGYVTSSTLFFTYLFFLSHFVLGYIWLINGWKFGGEWIRVCMAESLCCVPESITVFLLFYFLHFAALGLHCGAWDFSCCESWTL